MKLNRNDYYLLKALVFLGMALIIIVFLICSAIDIERRTIFFFCLIMSGVFSFFIGIATRIKGGNKMKGIFWGIIFSSMLWYLIYFFLTHI